MDTVEAWDVGRTGDVIMPDPKVHIGGVENGEKGEPPANAVNDDLLATLEELVDDCSEKQKVNEGPGQRRLGWKQWKGGWMGTR